MSKLYDVFPDELRKLTSDSKPNKKKKVSNTNHYRNTKKQSNVTYAFPKVKKLPLETKRNILSAMNHFENVKKVNNEDKKLAYKKIIKAAESFEICTMGFIDKYKDKILS